MMFLLYQAHFQMNRILTKKNLSNETNINFLYGLAAINNKCGRLW